MRRAERQRKVRHIAVSMAVIMLLCAVPTTAHADVKDTEKKLNEAKEEKEKTENALSSAREELDSLQETTEGLKGELNSLNNSLTEVSNNLAQLEEQIEDKQEEIEQTGAALEEAKQVEAQQYAAMKKRIQFMYEKRDYVLLEMLFGSASFSELLNRNEYIEQLSAYDREQLTLYQETRAQIEATEARLISEKEEMDELRVQVEAEQSRFAGLVSQTSGRISSYQHMMSETEQEMLVYEQRLAEQNNNIAQLQKQLEEERRLSLLASQSAWRDISEISFAEGDRYLLANLIYCEAGNQPFEGQVGVGAVVMNRVMSSVFPDTVVGVIYQNNQFSPVASGRLALALSEDRATADCYRAADQAMKGATTVGNCLFFRTPIEGLGGKQIGGHIFY